MAKYDYSIKIIGQVDLEQIKEDLKSQTFNIDVKLTNETRSVINELKQLATNLGDTFNNIGRAAGKVSRATSIRSADELELLRREKSKQMLISQLESKIAMGDRSGSFGVEAGNVSGASIRASYAGVLETVKNLNVETDNYKESLVKAQTEAAKLQTPYKIIQKEAQKTLDQTDNLWSMFKKKMVSAIAYRMIFSVFNTLRWAANSVIKTTIDIDTQLRDINKVLDLTDRQMVSIVDKANELAIAYGRTTVEVMKAMEYFAKAGFVYTQMEGLAELSVKLQNVGDLTSDAASSFIIAVNAAYQLDGSLQELSKTIDMVNNLANNAAVSVDFLSEAMKVSGSVAYSAGLSMEEYAAALTTIGAATQRGGREVGNGLKTIILRLTQVTDSSGEMADGISKVEGVLRNVGIEIRDTPNTFKPAMETLTELAEKWGSLTDLEKRAITYNLAGVYRSNILESFLANINDYEENLFIALNSVGSATRENELYIKSLEAGINKLKASWEKFVVKMEASKVIKFILESIAFAVRNLDIAIYTLAVMSIPIIIMKFPALMAAMRGLFWTTKTLESGITSLTLSLNAFIAVAALLVIAVMAIADAVRSAREEQERALEVAKNKVDKYMAEYGQLNILIKQYEDLRKQYEKTGEGAEQLRDIQNQLIAQYGSQAKGIDLVNGSYERNIDLLKELKREQLERALEDNEAAAVLAQRNLTKGVDKFSGLAKKKWYSTGDARVVSAYRETFGLGDFVTSDALYEHIRSLSLNEYETLLKELSGELVSKSRAADKERLKKQYDKHLVYIQEQLELVDKYIGESRAVLDARATNIKNLAKMDMASEISGLHGRERSILEYISDKTKVDANVSPQKALDGFKKSLGSIIEILDGIDADNAEEKWQKILGLNIGVKESDKETFLDYITNTSVALQNLISNLKETMSPFEQYIKKMQDLEKAYSNMYDLRRDIAEEAGLTGQDYMDFALGGDGFLGLIENDDLRNLAKSIQDDFIKYQEDIQKSEAEGLNNQATITALYETQVKIKEKELKILQKQLAIDEKRKNLHALENERTQRMFIGGQIVYDIDYAAVEKAREEVNAAEKEKTKLESEKQTDLLIAEEQKKRLELNDSIEELSKSIKLSSEEASDALEAFSKNLDKYSKILIDGEEGVGGGVRSLVIGIADLLKEIGIEKNPDKIMGYRADEFYDYANRGRITKEIMEKQSVSIGTVNVSGVDSIDDIIDEINTMTRMVLD